MTREALCRSIGVAALAGLLGTACSDGGTNPDAGTARGGHGGGAAGAAGGGGGAAGAAGQGGGGGSGKAGQDGGAGSAGKGGAGAGGGAGAAGQGGAAGPSTPGESVLMHHNHLNRDGVYRQPALTKIAAAGLHPDSGFRVSFVGAVYGQPLYVDNGPGGTDLVIVATEADTVHAFDASSGQQVWAQTLGTPVARADMPCGNIDPLGITGTPVIDFASRTLFVTAMSTPDGGSTKQYGIYALSIDDGTVRSGWPIDVTTALAGLGGTFTPYYQSQRGALAIVNGILYVPFGGLAGDCGDYRGWVVAIPLSNPQALAAWSTGGRGGGIWGPGGVSSDGKSIFVATGNTLGATAWVGGEAVFRFPASMPLATTPSYWAPTNWLLMDGYDIDLGSAAPIVFDLPGATPSHLVLALGKSGVGYLVDADNLGGIASALSSTQAASTEAIGAHVIYSTATATYLAYRAGGESCSGGNTGTDLSTLVLVPGSPPRFDGSWCTTTTGFGSPIVTTTDGRADTIVWVVAAEGNELLQGFDGDTGATIFAGANAPIAGVHRYTVPIAAKGRIFVAADDTVVAFTP